MASQREFQLYICININFTMLNLPSNININFTMLNFCRVMSPWKCVSVLKCEIMTSITVFSGNELDNNHNNYFLFSSTEIDLKSTTIAGRVKGIGLYL